MLDSVSNESLDKNRQTQEEKGVLTGGGRYTRVKHLENVPSKSFTNLLASITELRGAFKKFVD